MFVVEIDGASSVHKQIVQTTQDVRVSTARTKAAMGSLTGRVAGKFLLADFFFTNRMLSRLTSLEEKLEALSDEFGNAVDDLQTTVRPARDRILSVAGTSADNPNHLGLTSALTSGSTAVNSTFSDVSSAEQRLSNAIVEATDSLRGLERSGQIANYLEELDHIKRNSFNRCSDTHLGHGSYSSKVDSFEGRYCHTLTGAVGLDYGNTGAYASTGSGSGDKTSASDLKGLKKGLDAGGLTWDIIGIGSDVISEGFGKELIPTPISLIVGGVIAFGQTVVDAIDGYNKQDGDGYDKAGAATYEAGKGVVKYGGALGIGFAAGFGGAKAGAAIGATIGSVAPGVGTAIGGAAGALIGGVVGIFAGNAWQDHIDSVDEDAQRSGVRDSIIEGIGDTFRAGGKFISDAWSSATDAWNSATRVFTGGGFGFGFRRFLGVPSDMGPCAFGMACEVM